MKVQSSDLASRLWSTLVKLHSISTIQDHYDIIVKYSKPHLNFSSQNYSWFMQYMNYDNGDLGEKHTKPPKNCNHKYNFSTIKIFGNVCTSHLGFLNLKK
jgi:hypothetical protein